MTWRFGERSAAHQVGYTHPSYTGTNRKYPTYKHGSPSLSVFLLSLPFLINVKGTKRKPIIFPIKGTPPDTYLPLPNSRACVRQVAVRALSTISTAEIRAIAAGLSKIPTTIDTCQLLTHTKPVDTYSRYESTVGFSQKGKCGQTNIALVGIGMRPNMKFALCPLQLKRVASQKTPKCDACQCTFRYLRNERIRVPIGLGVDSSFCPTIVHCFPRAFGGVLERRIPGKNGNGRYP